MWPIKPRKVWALSKHQSCSQSRFISVIIRKHLLFSLTVASFYASESSEVLQECLTRFLLSLIAFYKQGFHSKNAWVCSFSSCFWSRIDSLAVFFLLCFGMKPLCRTSNGRRASVWFVLCFLEPLNHLRTNATRLGGRKKLQYVQFSKRKWTFHSWVFVLDGESLN